MELDEIRERKEMRNVFSSMMREYFANKEDSKLLRYFLQRKSREYLKKFCIYNNVITPDFVFTLKSVKQEMENKFKIIRNARGIYVKNVHLKSAEISMDNISWREYSVGQWINKRIQIKEFHPGYTGSIVFYDNEYHKNFRVYEEPDFMEQWESRQKYFQSLKEKEEKEMEKMPKKLEGTIINKGGDKLVLHQVYSIKNRKKWATAVACKISLHTKSSYTNSYSFRINQSLSKRLKTDWNIKDITPNGKVIIENNNNGKSLTLSTDKVEISDEVKLMYDGNFLDFDGKKSKKSTGPKKISPDELIKYLETVSTNMKNKSTKVSFKGEELTLHIGDDFLKFGCSDVYIDDITKSELVLDLKSRKEKPKKQSSNVEFPVKPVKFQFQDDGNWTKIGGELILWTMIHQFGYEEDSDVESQIKRIKRFNGDILYYPASENSKAIGLRYEDGEFYFNAALDVTSIVKKDIPKKVKKAESRTPKRQLVNRNNIANIINSLEEFTVEVSEGKNSAEMKFTTYKGRKKKELIDSVNSAIEKVYEVDAIRKIYNIVKIIKYSEFIKEMKLNNFYLIKART